MPFYLKGLFPWKAFPALYEGMLSNIKYFFLKMGAHLFDI